MKNQDQIMYEGVVDKKHNPFSIPSWCKEGNPEGSGREMTKKRKGQFETVLINGGRIADIKQPNYEKYPAFQAIRWKYAVVIDDKLFPTEKWNDEIKNKHYAQHRV